MSKTLDSKLKVKHSTRKLDKLRPNEYNPRKISKKAKQKLRNSLLDFGYVDPIIINTHKDRKNVIISGHQRYYIMKEDLVKEVDVVEVNINPKKEKLLNIALNNKNLMGDWDDEKLTEVMGELFKDEVDLSMTGFDELELDNILEPLGLFENEQDDVVPEVPEEPKTKLGDIYELGKHRLLCGDSTKKEDVMTLMSHEKADMVFTDPPYNIGFEYENYNDNKTDKEYLSFSRKWFNLIENIQKIIITPGPRNLLIWEQIKRAKDIGTWRKTNSRSGASVFNFRLCEPIIFYGNFQKKRNTDFFDYARSIDSVLTESEKKSDVRHVPPAKPVNFISDIIKSYSEKNNIILDLFGGSGSTMIACEKINRICYMMEIDPKYCDVIIKRWEDYTNKKAKLVKSNG